VFGVIYLRGDFKRWRKNLVWSATIAIGLELITVYLQGRQSAWSHARHVSATALSFFLTLQYVPWILESQFWWKRSLVWFLVISALGLAFNLGFDLLQSILT
jgi:hypothetical protein